MMVWIIWVAGWLGSAVMLIRCTQIHAAVGEKLRHIEEVKWRMIDAMRQAKEQESPTRCRALKGDATDGARSAQLMLWHRGRRRDGSEVLEGSALPMPIVDLAQALDVERRLHRLAQAQVQAEGRHWAKQHAHLLPASAPVVDPATGLVTKEYM